jgi:hypothetical protein
MDFSDIENICKVIVVPIAAFLFKSTFAKLSTKKCIYIDIPDHGVNQYSLAHTFKQTQLITISCPHDITIEKDDYRRVLLIEFEQGCEINSVSIGDKSGENISPTVELVGNEIKILPFRFRQGDWFTIVVKHKGVLRASSISGQIGKISLSINTPVARYRKKSRHILFSLIFCLTLCVIGCVSSSTLAYLSVIGLLCTYIWLWLIAKSPSPHWGKL